MLLLNTLYKGRHKLPYCSSYTVKLPAEKGNTLRPGLQFPTFSQSFHKTFSIMAAPHQGNK